MRLNLLERFMAWLDDIPASPEEKALMFEEARRLKLKNDWFEAAARRRAARQSEGDITVGVWRLGCKLDGKDGHIVIRLVESPTIRGWRVDNFVSDENGEAKNMTVAYCTPFVNVQKFFTNWVRPWMEGSITTKQLAQCGHHSFTSVKCKWN